jgi:PAS domain S-box-containing protein
MRSGQIAFAISVLALLVAIRLAAQHVRAVAQQEGAAQERAEVLERISDGFMALDADWRFTYLNAEGERSLQSSRQALIGKVVWEALPLLAKHESAAHYREAMATQKPQIYETYAEIRRAWYEMRLYPAPSGLSVYFRDITEERKMREALGHSEQRHRRIVETAQEGIWTFGPDGNTTFVNRKLSELLGYAPQEMIGKPLFAFLDAEGQRLAAENLQRQAIGLRERHDFKFRRKDGRELWALLSISPLDPASPSSDTLVMLTDITSRRRAESERAQLSERERSLRLEAEASQQRYRVLADLVPYIVWTHGVDGMVDFVNRAFADFTGAPLERATGMGWQTFMHPDDVQGCLEALKHSLATGEEFANRARYRRADGVYVWHVGRAQPVRDSHGQVIRWFGLLEPEAAGLAQPPPSPEARVLRI